MCTHGSVKHVLGRAVRFFTGFFFFFLRLNFHISVWRGDKPRVTLHQGVGVPKPARCPGGSVRRLHPTIHCWEVTLHRAAGRAAKHRAAHQRPAWAPDPQQRDPGWGQTASTQWNLVAAPQPRTLTFKYELKYKEKKQLQKRQNINAFSSRFERRECWNFLPSLSEEHTKKY